VKAGGQTCLQNGIREREKHCTDRCGASNKSRAQVNGQGATKKVFLHPFEPKGSIEWFTRRTVVKLWEKKS